MRRVRCNRFGLRLTDVVADLDNQCRHVVEQAFRREDVACVDRHQIEQAREPSRRELLVLVAHARADEVAEVRSDHESHTDGRDCSTIGLDPEPFSISRDRGQAQRRDAGDLRRREQTRPERFIETDSRMKLVDRQVLVLGVRDVDGSRSDEDGRAEIRELRDIGRVRKDCAFEP